MPALVVVTGEEAAAAKSFRNLPRVSVVTAEGVGVAEIIGHRSLIASEGALEVLEARAGAVERGSATPPRGATTDGPRQVIIEPVVSEKSYALMAEGKYTFRVNDRAHKTQISHAVAEIFDVEVAQVRTSRVRSKPKRRGIHPARPAPGRRRSSSSRRATRSSCSRERRSSRREGITT